MGSSYKVCQNGKTIFKKHYGVTDLNEKTPVSDKTIFRLASMTKPVTAVAILILIDRGLISLSEPVKKHIPGFENIHIVTENGEDMGETKTDVTVMHLLTHTSGFGSIKPTKMTTEDKKTVKNTVNCFIKAGLDFEPFTKKSYSPFAAFDVLVALTEKITGEDFEEFLKNEIFIPCDMKDTTFIPSEKQWERIITMHAKSEDGKSCKGQTTNGCVFEDFPANHKLGGAGLVSTLEDYSNFAEMLLNNGKTAKTRIVSEKTSRLLSTPYIPPCDIITPKEQWGLGVRVVTSEDFGTLSKGSFGWSGAYGSHFWVDPENNITAVFMKNSKFDGGSSNQSARRFESAVYDSLIN